MPTRELSGTTALVTGASRGCRGAIAIALSGQGAHVVGVARDRTPLEELRAQLGGTFTPVAADATDPVVAGLLLDHHPRRPPPPPRAPQRRGGPVAAANPPAHLADLQP